MTGIYPVMCFTRRMIKMDNTKYNFLITTDKDTADILVNHGLKLIQSAGNTFIFLNNQNKMQFSGSELLKVVYTNKMMF